MLWLEAGWNGAYLLVQNSEIFIGNLIALVMLDER
jgi:hypothetical protein